MKELSEFDYFKAWLLFFAVATGGSALAGIIVGSFLAAFMGAGGATLLEIAKVARVVAFIIGLPISYVTFRAVVGKFLLPKLEED